MMIVGHWALILNTVSIALISLLIVKLFLYFMWNQWSQHFIRIKAEQRKVLLWLFVGSPLIITTIIVSLMMFSQNRSIDWINQITHWHHSYWFDFVSWHGVLLSVFLLFSFWHFSKLAYLWIEQQLHLRSLDMLGVEKTQHYYLIKSSKPIAFTAGFFNPKCYITEGLQNELSSKFLDIVIMHEQAHIKSRDPLTKQLFLLFCTLYPKNMSTAINRLYQLTLEEMADKKVLQRFSAVDIAKCLLMVTKLQKQYQKHGFVYFAKDHISLRIDELLSPKNIMTMPILITFAISFALFISTALLIDTTHHLVESLFVH